MRFILAIFVCLTLLTTPSAQAKSSHSCQAFVDHILFKLGHESLDAIRRKNSTVKDGGKDLDRPFVTVDLKDPERGKSFKLDTATESETGWLLKLTIPPMRSYTYHFQVRDHVCRLERLEVNGSPLSGPRDCARSKSVYANEACDWGDAFFAAQSSKKHVEIGKSVTSDSAEGGVGN